MWLPRTLYEAKPHLSVAAGLLCFLVAWFVENSPRGTLFVVGGGLATLGVLLWMRRRDYRRTQAAYDPRALDE